jgi:hypothetical protein
LRPLGLNLLLFSHNIILFLNLDLPCRIVVCFVETPHKNGTYHSNPFAFYRSWEVKDDTPPKPDPGQFEQFQNASNTRIQKIMDEKFEKLQSQFDVIAALLQQKNQKQPKHKGRGKKTKKNTNEAENAAQVNSDTMPVQETISDPIQSTSRGTRSQTNSERNEAMIRLNSYIGDQQQQQHNINDFNSDLFTEDGEELTSGTKTVYIQKVDCQFNGNSIDSIEDKATVDQAMQQFWRMYYFNGQISSLFSNGLTYSDFLKGYFFCVYDLSTSNKAGSSYLVPAIRVGHLRMR